ncbi:Cerato-platanin, partial [Wolfiporia cocos MD-104 SS10]
AALAQSTVPVSYDTTYDNSTSSLNVTACSYELERLGFTTLGSLPDFPYIGGASVVPPNGSSGCGTCWELEYDGNTVAILAVDYTQEGFNLAKEATASQVDSSACGL